MIDTELPICNQIADGVSYDCLELRWLSSPNMFPKAFCINGEYVLYDEERHNLIVIHDLVVFLNNRTRRTEQIV